MHPPSTSLNKENAGGNASASAAASNAHKGPASGAGLKRTLASGGAGGTQHRVAFDTSASAATTE